MLICYNDYPGQFWAEREADFLRFAEEIYVQNPPSNAVVSNVADYFVLRLETLWTGRSRSSGPPIGKFLNEHGQYKLVGYLHNRTASANRSACCKRWSKANPTTSIIAGSLMYAYFRTNRKEELLGLLKQTDAYFHQKNRWGEGPMAMLAGSCLQTELFEQSVQYYKEVIPLHEQTAPNRGIGDGTLSGYYGGEAQAFAGLKKTPEAVEAACGAIVSWGSNSRTAPRPWNRCERSCKAAKARCLHGRTRRAS